jgi:hypothetical protein
VRCVAILGVVFALAVGVGGAGATPTAAVPFELVVDGHHETVPQSPEFPYAIRHAGTFTAGSPFCASGTFVDLTNDLLLTSVDFRLYTCADGSGAITTQQEDFFEHKPPYTDTWLIVRGTGRYVDLRGKGTYVGGPPLTGDPADEDPLTETYRTAYRGMVDFDAIAPTVTLSSATIAKLGRPAGSYALRLRLVLRDNKPGNPISYTAAVEPAGGGLYLVEKRGTSRARTVTLNLRIRPEPRARKVLLDLRAEDPVGNWRLVTRPLKLPR